jgi:hypothetical protein
MTVTVRSPQSLGSWPLFKLEGWLKHPLHSDSPRLSVDLAKLETHSHVLQPEGFILDAPCQHTSFTPTVTLTATVKVTECLF